MLRYLARRALALLPVFFLMTIILFLLIRMVPGDPIDVMYGAEGLEETQRAALEKSLGLDQPIYLQYLKWIGRALIGDL